MPRRRDGPGSSPTWWRQDRRSRDPTDEGPVAPAQDDCRPPDLPISKAARVACQRVTVAPNGAQGRGSQPRRQRGALDPRRDRSAMAGVALWLAAVAVLVDRGGQELHRHDRGTHGSDRLAGSRRSRLRERATRMPEPTASARIREAAPRAGWCFSRSGRHRSRLPQLDLRPFRVEDVSEAAVGFVGEDRGLHAVRSAPHHDPRSDL